jgi:tRNA G18 (ribose-2'-O)-methylase SpoU
MQRVLNEELGRPDAQDFKSRGKQKLVVILDCIRSLANVGSAFRTCDAFAIEHLYLCGITGTPPHREIEKSALGASDSVEWSHHKDISVLLAELKTKGYTLVAVEQTRPSVFLHEFEPQPDVPLALVFGNEVFGVSDEALAACDIGLEIPQFGTKHSLNIAVSLGVVLWDISTKRKFQME